MHRCVLLSPLLLPLLTMASVFDAPELRVAPSPAQAAQLRLAPGTRAVDSDVSPAGPRVALLVVDAAGVAASAVALLAASMCFGKPTAGPDCF